MILSSPLLPEQCAIFFPSLFAHGAFALWAFEGLLLHIFLVLKMIV